MENNKTNDWFATLLYNQDKSIDQIINAGLNSSNTGLQSRDYYRTLDPVQNAF